MNGGNGTIVPSYALANYLNENGCQAKVIDIMAETNPLGDLLCNGYNFLLRYSIFSASMYMELAHTFPIDNFSTFNKMSCKRLGVLLDKENPDAIVLICPWISRMILSAVKKLKNTNRLQPLVFVNVVDLGTGMTLSWINNNVDFTFLPTDNAYRFLTAQGLNQKKTSVLGVPLLKEFEAGSVTESEKVKAKLKNNFRVNDFVVAILGGSEGGTYTLSILKKLQKHLNGFEYIVQCGTNQRLYTKIEILTKIYKNVHPMGFVDSMRELYSMSDIVITKPGAITISELIISRVPFIIITYPIVMPQERGNVDFVKENKLGFIANDIQSLSGIIQNIRTGEIRIAYKKSSEKVRNNLFGTRKIGDKIISEIEKK